MGKDYIKTNLDVTTFRNGEPIPHAQSDLEWVLARDLEKPAYCVYNGNILYNWYAVNDPRGLAPKGWKIPTDEEMDLLDFLNYPQYDGCRSIYGTFFNRGSGGYWWSATATATGEAWGRYLVHLNVEVYRDDDRKGHGFSVRCLRDENGN